MPDGQMPRPLRNPRPPDDQCAEFYAWLIHRTCWLLIGAALMWFAGKLIEWRIR